ncbi:uncharacterized protein BDR25DRAFT_307875 [Lindgomyces ingoldianus]|uniref:Uncharacterized protein n=1 Tax=Lindgomyces ingoldianus TaxID=673940 RepID=A0ACB6QAV3_9PLEO|nr:uncharacterized protein BDR25DRAFT_307875 [Lindgomyces ingoldianus]KAF2463281.1 hypothetical protein BDR25DRAFT_307875 [Lindgomyces ingoldianus]
MNRLSRIHDPPAYGDRIPSQNNLYDWSPANEADDEDELDRILAELRREQPNTHPEILRVLGRSQLDAERESRIRTYSSRLLSSNQPSQSADSSLRSATILQSVRRHPRFSASSRRGYEHAFPPETQRDSGSRSPHHSESRDRYTVSESARQAARQRLSELHTSLERDRDRDRDMLARVDSYRRSYLDRNSTSPSTVSPLLEQTIKYLSRIRHSNTEDDSLNFALDAGFLNKDYFCEENSDFVLDTCTLPPPAETSWLAPGAVLNGCQHATSVTSTVTSTAGGATTTLYRFRNNDSMTSTTFEPGRPWLSHSYTPPQRRATNPTGPEIVTSHTPTQDRWPVKVTIHAVDYSTMCLSATMEAYNVPSHPHSHQSLLSASVDRSHTPFTRTSSITTYLEGEILDFNQHTLLTESFKSSPSNDATYWRKLPPFQKFTDDELVRNLVSKRWFTEVLSREWILMRWKERCFVKSLNRSTADPPAAQPPHPNFDFASTTSSDISASSTAAVVSFNTTSSRENHPDSADYHRGNARQQEMDRDREVFDDSGCGLTISGFYYVCLKRADGKLEGLYYDPQSSPYQHLKLESVNGGVFPAWEFK